MFRCRAGMIHEARGVAEVESTNKTYPKLSPSTSHVVHLDCVKLLAPATICVSGAVRAAATNSEPGGRRTPVSSPPTVISAAATRPITARRRRGHLALNFMPALSLLLQLLFGLRNGFLQRSQRRGRRAWWIVAGSSATALPRVATRWSQVPRQ